MTTKAEAAKELLKRRNARSSLLDYYRYTFKQFQEGEHIKKIVDALESVERGECKRLMISMPPRHSKSETAAIRFPVYLLGKHPDKEIVLASYSDTEAAKQSRKARELFYSIENKRLFPDSVPKNVSRYKTADKEWSTTGKGGFYSTGIGGGLTGRGFDIGIIDDYLKDRQEAGSDTTKSRILDWYRSTFYTRQSPTAAIIIIATRWASDDLIGTLEEEEEKNGGEQWTKIFLPAISEEGNALWPDRFDIDWLLKTKQSIGSYEWSALYQCEPTVREGNRFNTDNIKWHDNLEYFPQGKYSRYWDLASTKKERDKDSPDYTVGVLGAVVKNNFGIRELWIKDIVFGQWDAPQRDERIRQATTKDGVYTSIYVEAFGAYKDAYIILKQALKGRYIVRKSQLPGDKSAKATPLEPIFEAGNVHILKGPWRDELEKQFKEFPFGRHDDIVDACAILVGESIKPQTSLMVR